MNDLVAIAEAIKSARIRSFVRDASAAEGYSIEIDGSTNKYQLVIETRSWHTGDHTYPAYDVIVSCNGGPARRFIDELCLEDFQDIWENFKSTFKETK